MIFEKVRQLLEMIRFSHTIFALPFAMLAAVMAWTTPRPDGGPHPFVAWHLLGILVCMVGARSAAMAFNRLVDRDIDSKNPRTQNRHLPSGALSVREVVAFIAVSAVVFQLGTLMFLPNWLPLAFSLPVLGFLCLYSLTKRFTNGAHFWLGAALMLAPVSTWIALRGTILLQTPADLFPSLLLGLSVLLWVGGFDIIYACQDAEFDTRHKLRSVPARFGLRVALRLAAISHLLMVVVLGLLPYACPQLGLSWPYGLAVVGVTLLLSYEHMLVRPDDLARVNVAFFHLNAIISVGLFVVGTFDLLT